MKILSYRNGSLFIENVDVQKLAQRYGTPLYIYSQTQMRERYTALTDAMKAAEPLVCYSVKANTNNAVIATFAEMGAGADVVSGGELYRARRAGVDARRIVFAGVGKATDEIEYALREGVLFFTVESEPELNRIGEVAKRLKVKARVAFRVNPDVDPKTHKYVSTGKKENKFGMDPTRARAAYAQAARLKNVDVAGLHVHIGSQILSAEPFGEALAKITPLCEELKARFPSTFRYIDIGGGIGIPYKPGDKALPPKDYAKAVLPTLKQLKLSVVIEPGRFLVAESGYLLTRVQYVKEGPGKKFIVVDAGMNTLIRPSLYDAYHHVIPVKESRQTAPADLVGPVCESGDFLALDRALPVVEQDDLLVLTCTGAYGFTMASNYNSRRRPAEVMTFGIRHSPVREREAYSDLVRGEQLPTWMKEAAAGTRENGT